MPSIPVNTLLGYIGVFLFFAGIVLCLCGLDILKLSIVTVKPSARTCVIGIIITIVGFLLGLQALP